MAWEFIRVMSNLSIIYFGLHFFITSVSPVHKNDLNSCCSAWHVIHFPWALHQCLSNCMFFIFHFLILLSLYSTVLNRYIHMQYTQALANNWIYSLQLHPIKATLIVKLDLIWGGQGSVFHTRMTPIMFFTHFLYFQRLGGVHTHIGFI